MEIAQIIQIGLAIIGGASIALKTIAPITKTKADDKLLKLLNKVLEFVSLHKK